MSDVAKKLQNYVNMVTANPLGSRVYSREVTQLKKQIIALEKNDQLKPNDKGRKIAALQNKIDALMNAPNKMHNTTAAPLPASAYDWYTYDSPRVSNFDLGRKRKFKLSKGDKYGLRRPTTKKDAQDVRIVLERDGITKVSTITGRQADNLIAKSKPAKGAYRTSIKPRAPGDKSKPTPKPKTKTYTHRSPMQIGRFNLKKGDVFHYYPTNGTGWAGVESVKGGVKWMIIPKANPKLQTTINDETMLVLDNRSELGSPDTIKYDDRSLKNKARSGRTDSDGKSNHLNKKYALKEDIESNMMEFDDTVDSIAKATKDAKIIAKTLQGLYKQAGKKMPAKLNKWLGIKPPRKPPTK